MHDTRSSFSRAPGTLGGSSHALASELIGVSVATANVNTLHPGRAKYLGASGRSQLLEMGFDASRIDIAGIQEGRTNASQRISGIVYDMLVSASNASGCYGTQIWVRRSPDFNIQSWSPRCPRLCEALILHTPSKRLFQVVAAHAPHECDSDLRKNEFWDLLMATFELPTRVTSSSCSRTLMRGWALL